MNVGLPMGASSAPAPQWDQLYWNRCQRQVRRLQARIVKATRDQPLCETGPAEAGLRHDSSRQ